MSVPSTTKTWRVTGSNGLDSVVYDDAAPVPQLGDHEVLVKFHAAALNSRDASIPYVSTLCHSEHVR